MRRLELAIWLAGRARALKAAELAELILLIPRKRSNKTDSENKRRTAQNILGSLMNGCDKYRTSDIRLALTRDGGVRLDMQFFQRSSYSILTYYLH